METYDDNIMHTPVHIPHNNHLSRAEEYRGGSLGGFHTSLLCLREPEATGRPSKVAGMSNRRLVDCVLRGDDNN